MSIIRLVFLAMVVPFTSLAMMFTGEIVLTRTGGMQLEPGVYYGEDELPIGSQLEVLYAYESEGADGIFSRMDGSLDLSGAWIEEVSPFSNSGTLVVSGSKVADFLYIGDGEGPTVYINSSVWSWDGWLAAGSVEFTGPRAAQIPDGGSPLGLLAFSLPFLLIWSRRFARVA